MLCPYNLQFFNIKERSAPIILTLAALSSLFQPLLQPLWD